MRRKTVLLLLILLPISDPFVHLVHAEREARIVASRIVSVDVKLVFVGIGESDVDLQYMSWSENLPKTVNTQVIIGGKDIGVTSNIKYQYSFASSNFKEKLISYLSSIAESKPSRTPVIQSNQLSSFASLCMALTEEPDKCFR